MYTVCLRVVVVVAVAYMLYHMLLLIYNMLLLIYNNNNAKGKPMSRAGTVKI